MRDCLVVIPARYASTRFPGKVLARLGGRPVVEWCYGAATKARVGPVVVATEDRRVARVVESFGGRVVLTSPNCPSGTDRVHEAARGFTSRFVINLQGDLPLICPRTIRRVAELLRRGGARIATAVVPLRDRRRAADPNVVKAALCGALARRGGCRVLYFSRSPIPYSKNGGSPRFEHLGIYGFERAALERFVRLAPSPLERAEGLEQLRALEAGLAIHAAVVEDLPAAIDTPADLRRARRLLKRLNREKRPL